MGERFFDLLGDPIPDGRGEVGRTGHVATAQNVSRVRELLVSGMGKGAIAAELGISIPTLNKHYFESGRVSLAAARAKAVAESKAKALLLLNREAAKGNVTAIKAVLAAAEKAELAILETAFGDKPRQARRSARPVEAKPVAPGKKDQADRDAATAGQGTWWDNDLEPGKLN